MKKFLFLILSSFLTFSVFADVNAQTKAILNKYTIVTVKNKDYETFSKDIDSIDQQYILKNANTGEKNAYSRLKFIKFALDGKNHTFNELSVYYRDILAKIKLNNNDYGFWIINKEINPYVTTQLMLQAKQYFGKLDKKTQNNNLSWYTAASIANDFDKEKVIQTFFDYFKQLNFQQRSSNFYAAYRYNEFSNGKYNKIVANTYFMLAQKQKLQVDQLKLVNKMINYCIQSQDFDAQTFKKQLNIIRIVYTNKLTTTQGKQTYGTFVSIIENTYKSL